MNRRELIQKTGVVGAGVLAMGPAAMAASTHGKHKSLPQKNKNLIETASACRQAGEMCVSHCAELLASGDKSVGECNKTALAMIETCSAVIRLASLDNKNTRELARVCAKVCRDCMEACEPHVKHHADCKACYDACKDCAEVCEQF